MIFHWAVRTRSSWPAHYRIFLLFFFASWAAVVWLRPYRPSNGLLISAVLFAAVALAIGFVPARPPRNRPETKNLLERVDRERNLERFFRSDLGKIFWPVLAFLMFSITFRLATIF